MVFSEHTTQFPDKVAIQALIDELKAYVDNLSNENIDLSDYVTKNELQSKIDALNINIDLSSYVTKAELATAIVFIFIHFLTIVILIQSTIQSIFIIIITRRTSCK
jgi:hypothetical protein